MNDLVVPDRVGSLLSLEVAHELAAVYAHQVVFPERIMVDHPGNPDRMFLDWPSPVLVVAVENQGVCQWGVPLDGDVDPPVILGGDVFDAVTGELISTGLHAPSIEGFISARRWDADCLKPKSLIQAQAAPLDTASLDFLRFKFEELPSTAGWPGANQYRFQLGQTRILLWSAPGQCDWFVSDPHLPALSEAVRSLVNLSDLKKAFWAAEATGENLLRELRRT